MSTARAVLCLAVAVVLAACSSAPGTGESTAPAPNAATPSPPVAGASLEAYHWDLTRATDARGQAIAALQPVAGRPLRLDFNPGQLGVSGGCNRIGGPYQYRNDLLQAGPLRQTQMACVDQRLMELDVAIAARLEGALRTRLDPGATPQLELIAGNGDRLVFAGTPTWQTRYGSPGTIAFLEVAPQRAPCSHPLIPNMQCLQVRERTYAADGALTSQGDWQPLHQEIEGYTHTPGTRNVLRVKKFAIKNPPADAPSVAYVLDMVVESEIVESR